MESFSTFLSHKYDAPAVNEFFFRLFSDLADVQFEVDAGKTSTNVTRLERMIRDADGFIGIYPLEKAEVGRPSSRALLEGSEYFRLELDLAARAKKPGLIYADSRFGNTLSPPDSVLYETFNITEIMAPGAKPSTARFLQAFNAFSDRVIASKKFSLSELRFAKVTSQVGILVPIDDGSHSYGKEQIELLRDEINDAGFDPVPLGWPVVLTPRTIGQLRQFDWMAVDIGPTSMSTGIIGYLHGTFVPSIRLLRVDDPNQMHEIPSPLYSGVNVGYRKDIIRWSDLEVLQLELRKRLKSLSFGTRRISTTADAMNYFLAATRRKEAVFVSYAGEDETLSENLRAAFRKKFQQVFDYRDGRSLAPGQSWVSQIFDQIGRSALGISLLSSNYVQSGNCLHELRQMVALSDGGKLRMVPIKLRRDDHFELPPEIRSTQYARTWEFGSPDEVVDWIAKTLPEKASSGGDQ